MSRHGHPLKERNADGIFTCPESGLRYSESGLGILKCMDIDEEAPLPEELAVGKILYDDLKQA
jgi:UDP-2-acetamido-3-amino-2,3-dideoxy-glucuronate N-acetyltransferase